MFPQEEASLNSILDGGVELDGDYVRKSEGAEEAQLLVANSYAHPPTIIHEGDMVGAPAVRKVYSFDKRHSVGSSTSAVHYVVPHSQQHQARDFGRAITNFTRDDDPQRQGGMHSLQSASPLSYVSQQYSFGGRQHGPARTRENSREKLGMPGFMANTGNNKRIQGVPAARCVELARKSSSKNVLLSNRGTTGSKGASVAKCGASERKTGAIFEPGVHLSAGGQATAGVSSGCSSKRHTPNMSPEKKQGGGGAASGKRSGAVGTAVGTDKSSMVVNY